MSRARARAATPDPPTSTRPQHRAQPRSGWVNDPTGPVRYHLFFQHNPRAPVRDRISWGHTSRADLVRWRDEPVALAPGPGGPDAAGCWSGCVVLDGNESGDGSGDERGERRVTAVYTGANGGPDSARICLATARDERLHA